MENEQDAAQVLETEPAAPIEPTEPQQESISVEELADLKAKAAKADDLETKNKQLYERAKKAETKAPSDDISARDAVLLMQANVPAEDFDEVVQAALVLKKPLAEALKSSVVKTILAEKADERRTANATQTKAPARGASKVSGDDLLTKAMETNEVPDTDEGMAALAAARQARLTKKR